MKITLKPARSFERAVEFAVEGSAEPARIDCTWRVKGRQQLAEFLDRAAKGDQPGVLSLLEVLESWSGPVDEAGKPLPLNRRTLAALLDDYEQSQPAFINAYVDGCAELIEKN
jgi:hypothetical protein